MNDDAPHRAFELALDEALQLLASGVSREECLRRFPRYAAELAPLLTAAEAARAGLLADQPLPTPNLARGKRRLLEAARVSTPRPMGLLNVRWASAALALLLVILIGTGAASANALPGEALYPVKRGLEAMQLTLTFDSEARARLQAEQAERRRAETQAVLDLRRQARIEFEGVVEVVEREALWVSGLRVLTNTANEFQVADIVRVLAHTSTDAVIADQVILLARSTSPPIPTHAPTVTPTTTSTRPLDTPTATPTSTRQPLTATRIPPTASATLTVIRPTLSLSTETHTPPPTEARPTATPTPLRFTDTPTAEATATVPRPTSTATVPPTGRP